MSWKSLLIVAILLAIATAVGFGFEQPLVGLVALILFLVVGAYTLSKLAQEEPRKGKKKQKARSHR